MNKEILTPLLPFLSACLYGDAPSFYLGLDHPGRRELETQAKRFGMLPWLYRGLWKHIRSCGPERMRILYHLPKKGAWIRVIWAFVHYFCTRMWHVVCSFARHDKALRDYCHMVATLESKSSQETKCLLK